MHTFTYVRSFSFSHLSLISWKPRSNTKRGSCLTKLLFSLSLSPFFSFSLFFFLNSQHHEATNVARKRGAARVICRIIVPMYTSLFPSLPPKLYINYALFRTRPARLYFRSNRKTTPERKRTMALIYFSHLTTPPLPASRPRWVDASRSVEFTFFPPTLPLLSVLGAFAPSEETDIKERPWIKSIHIFTTGPRNADVTTTRLSRYSSLPPLILCLN